MSHTYAPFKNDNKAWDVVAISLMAEESYLLINTGR
jgi:hypothetical protein